MSSPARPGLSFDTIDAMLADADRLRRGYAKAGQWDLGMILDHLAKTQSAPFDTGRWNLPWPATAIVRSMIHGMVKRHQYPSFKVPMAPPLKPTPGVDVDEAYGRFRELSERIKRLPADTVAAPPFGRMSTADFVGIQLLHGAHHLAFLRPTDDV